MLAGAATGRRRALDLDEQHENLWRPVSDHFDGTHFFDPDGTPPKSFSEVLRWQFGGDRERTSWPDWVPTP